LQDGVSHRGDATVSAPFEIDVHSGKLRFTGLELELEPKQSLEEFLATEAAKRAMNGGGNDSWQRYHFRQQSLGDGILGVSLYFFCGRLLQVRFGYGPEGEGDWSTWSKERELARAATYRQELVRQLGRVGRFPGGFVDAAYDDKSAGARLFMLYEPSVS
jgi:hypothetical protein